MLSDFYKKLAAKLNLYDNYSEIIDDIDYIKHAIQNQFPLIN